MDVNMQDQQKKFLEKIKITMNMRLSSILFAATWRMRHFFISLALRWRGRGSLKQFAQPENVFFLALLKL